MYENGEVWRWVYENGEGVEVMGERLGEQDKGIEVR